MSRSVTLRDGGRIAYRPIRPDDRDALASAFDRLSEQSRYRRFFGPVPRLTARQLEYLTDVDHRDHEALIAFDEETGESIGVARYVRTGDDVAEPAVAVVDAWHGRGVASALLDALVERAREEEVGYFAAPVLAVNEPALNLLRGLGHATMERRGREVDVVIALPAREGAPVPLRQLLQAVAAGTVQPAVTLGHRLALGLRRTRTGTPRNTIVTAVAVEPDSASAVGVAADLAEASGASVHAVGVQRLLLDEGEPLADVLRATGDDLRARGLEVTTELRRGDTAAALLDAAIDQRARMIVVADETPGWNHVAHHAPCDVLIAREREADR